MKFQPDLLAGVNAVTRHEPGRLWVGGRPLDGSVLLPWQGDPLPWPLSDLAELRAEHFDAVVAMQPEVVILGTGDRLRFPSTAVLRAMIERRIGVESMDTAAAIRTYNVLAGEGRRVVGAFILVRGA